MQSLIEGTVLGPYTIIRLIGRGGMGEVYLAYEQRLDRQVALKVIAPKKVGDVNLIRRFLNEARTLAQVNHTNVVTIYSIDAVKDTQFIAMEHVEGAVFKDLFSLFAFSAEEAAPIFLQLLKGLRALHDKNILHRDIKPGNLILRTDGQIKILDFGIAKRASDDESADGKGKLVGTMAYLPPEVISGSPADVRSDLWSLGAIFYECLVGEPLVSPYGKKIVGVRAKADSDVVFPEECIVRVRPEMRAIVAQLCEPNPELRYPSAAAAAEDLKKFLKCYPPPGAIFTKALSLTVGKIEEVKLGIDMTQLKDGHSKRHLTTTLLNEVAQTMQSEQVTAVASPAAAFANSDELVRVTSDSISARQKSRRRLRRKNRGWFWPALLAVNLTALFAAAIWFGVQNMQPKKLEKVAVVATPLTVPSIPMSLSSPAPGEALWLEPTQVPTFTWSKVVSTGEYRLEIATDIEFKNISASEAVTGNFYRPDRAIPEGFYYWRLSPLSKAPLAGPARFSISLTTPLELMRPAANSVIETPHAVKEHTLTFGWACKPGARSYQVQISHTSNFTHIVKDETVATCTLDQVPLAAGNFFWRARVDLPTILSNSWSEVRGFAIRQSRPPVVIAKKSLRNAIPKPAPAPAPLPIAAPQLLEASSVFTLKFKNAEMVRDIASLRSESVTRPALRWRPVKGARSYIVEISRTPDFTHVIQQTPVVTPSMEWEKVSLGRVFWRVAAVGETEGPYSSEGQLEVRLPSPALSSVYSYSAQGFEWDAVPLAEKYIVQWSREPAMTKTDEKLTSTAQINLEMNNGSLYVRVAAANRQGKQMSEFSRVARVTSLPAGP